MDWNSHPNLYQLAHWWHWLSYGQDAAAVQALAAVVAACAAIAAGVFAARAYYATLSQLRIAREQLSLAHEQFAVERKRFEEEKQDAARKAMTVYERTVAEEDEARPRFRSINGYTPGNMVQNFEFKNVGSSAALAVTVKNVNSGQLLSSAQHIGAGGTILVSIDPTTLGNFGVAFRFKTAFGSTWDVIVRLNATEEVLSVERSYAPD